MKKSNTATFSPEGGLITNAKFIEKIQSTELPIVVTNKDIVYYNVPAAFDIETTSFYEGEDKRAIMYIWQFGILNWVTYGRTWDQLKVFLDVLSEVLNLDEDVKLVVYVHNLGYEFQFMRKWFEWSKVFLLDERKPVYCNTGGYEFKCSWKLSSKSLAKIGSDLQKYHVEKLVGDLDYSLMRHSKTPLTEKELGYCENDIRVLLAYIQEKIEQDGDITRIPLTNTGYVRQHCRKFCYRKRKRYRALMEELTLNPNEYEQLKRVFGGGFTHANVMFVGKVLEHLGSFDFTSSYPYVMLSEKFPMSKVKTIEKIDQSNEHDFSQLNYYLRNYCCMFDASIENIFASKTFEHPISSSHCRHIRGELLDNGRIIGAEHIEISMTEQDYFTYKEFYDWESITIYNFKVYEKSYLPTPFVKSILELYKRKTEFKDVAGKEIDYMISKNMLNAAYGMSVTDIVRENIEYLGDEYSLTKPDLEKAIGDYNRNIRRFLFYPWGVWVTAYARANLFSGILESGSDYVYSDTDSIKIRNPERHFDYISRYNQAVHRKLEDAARFHGFDVSEFSPKNIKGEAKTIGEWEFEGIYDRFKTLGAKRYMVQIGNKYYITVAGVNKKLARDFLVKNYADPFDGFVDGLVIPTSHSGRMISTYCDNEISGSLVDWTGRKSQYHELSYIHMEASEYTMSLSADFIKLLKGIKEDSE